MAIDVRVNMKGESRCYYCEAEMMHTQPVGFTIDEEGFLRAVHLECFGKPRRIPKEGY